MTRIGPLFKTWILGGLIPSQKYVDETFIFFSDQNLNPIKFYCASTFFLNFQ